MSRRGLLLSIVAAALVGLAGCGSGPEHRAEPDRPGPQERSALQEEVGRLASPAEGFFQRYDGPGHRPFVFIALQAKGEQDCAKLRDLDVATSIRLEIESPAEPGEYFMMAETSRTATFRLLSPSLPSGQGVLPSPSGLSIRKSEAGIVSGSFALEVPRDPLVAAECVSDSAAGTNERCTCSFSSGRTSECVGSQCCFRAMDDALSLAMPFEARPCAVLCDALRAYGYECLP